MEASRPRPIPLLFVPRYPISQVAAELERSLPHGMRAFERVSRTIQRLCNGYASLPGLLEWGRIAAARLEATKAAGNTSGLGGDARETDKHNAHSSGFQTYVRSGGGGAAGKGRGFSSHLRGATTAAPRITGRSHDERRLRGQQTGSATGFRSSGDHASPSSVSFAGAGFGTTDDRCSGGVWASSVAGPGHSSSSASASTASLYGRGSNANAPLRNPPAAAHETAYYFPKKAKRAGGGDFREANGSLRTGLGMSPPNNSGGKSSGGILCATEYGGGGGDGDSSSSVASLLREERAFKQRTGALQG